FRLAGYELARAVLGWIAGKEPGSLQSLSKPSEVMPYRG
ncbi:MAG: LacI family transcriptional regulator, partial [Mesorhizobium sp.]